MQNFVFQNSVKILFGKGQIAAIVAEIPASAKVLITCGGGSAEKNGTMDQVRAALKNHTFEIFRGIEPNPTYETLMKGVEVVRTQKIDFLLAVGGGSVIDGTKFIAAAAPFDGEPWDIVTKGLALTSAVSIGTVLTLPATGSEMNGGAVISRKSTQDKLAFRSPLVLPLFSVLDPTVTYSLPPRQISNGICDAFVHVMEQYLVSPSESALQDRFAESILQTLIEDGPKTLANPTDYEARASLMWCATMALNQLIGQGVGQDWSSHRIGHELTVLYGLDHGQTLAVVLPCVMQARREAKHAKLVQYAHRVWGLTEVNEEVLIDQAIDRTRAFFVSLGFPSKLEGYGVTCDIDKVVAQLDRHGLSALGERGEVTPSVVRQILAAA
ncbi:MAG: iron-containing alcohol dehydrogenase [Alphaproteobacteria bacterium]|nr:iron-containing alcohol dehydrogenase [Alphaproteobacteria bacterium]